MSIGDLGVLIPVAAITIGPIAWVANNWVRARHGFTPEDHADTMASGRKVELLTSENGRLTGQVSRLEERIAVLERIATDRPARLSEEIDSLR